MYVENTVLMHCSLFINGSAVRMLIRLVCLIFILYFMKIIGTNGSIQLGSLTQSCYVKRVSQKYLKLITRRISLNQLVLFNHCRVCREVGHDRRHWPNKTDQGAAHRMRLWKSGIFKRKLKITFRNASRLFIFSFQHVILSVWQLFITSSVLISPTTRNIVCCNTRSCLFWLTSLQNQLMFFQCRHYNICMLLC